MSSWPLIIVEVKTENFAFQKLGDLDSFLLKGRQILSKQITGRVVVLVLHNVLNDDLAGTNLVIFQGIINRISVEKPSIFDVSLLNFVFVNYREIITKVLREVVVQQELHRSTIKRKNGHHVCSIKF